MWFCWQRVLGDYAWNGFVPRLLLNLTLSQLSAVANDFHYAANGYSHLIQTKEDFQLLWKALEAKATRM